MTWANERLLALPNVAAAIDYEIVAADGTVAVAFRTGAVNGKTADSTAVANLADFSEYHPGEYSVRRRGGETIAHAHGGVCWYGTREGG
jgi:hypothetical protein